MNLYCALARQALKTYLATGQVLAPPADLPAEMLKQKAGVFVTLEKGKELRGCIGTFLPVYQCLAEEIIHNSIAAGTEDNRFLPVQRNEIDTLTITVSLLSQPEQVGGLEDLDPKCYGAIVESSRTKRRGLLLPDLPGINTPDKQVEICMQKGGITPDETEINLYRFTVIKYKE